MADIRSDASEIIHYYIPDFPVFFRNNHITKDYDFSDISIHWHDEVEFVYVYSGSIRHRLNGYEVRIGTGEGIFINSRQLHLIETDNAECDLLCLIFHPTILCSTSHVAKKCVAPIIENHGIPYIHMSEKVEWHKKIFQRLVDIDKSLDCYNCEMKIMSLLYEIWDILYENIDFEKAGPCENQNLSLVKKMITYVQSNYQNKITLKDICDAGMVGKTKGIRLFEQYLHLTPMEYVNHYRIEKAVYLLRETDLSMTQIAGDAGFSESSYFSKLFKEKIGKSPKQYRKEMEVIRDGREK